MNQKTTKQLDKLLTEIERLMSLVTPTDILDYIVTTKGARELTAIGTFSLAILGNFVEQSVTELIRCESEEKGIDTHL